MKVAASACEWMVRPLAGARGYTFCETALAGLLVAVFLAGCAIKEAPTPAEIRQQTGSTISTLDQNKTWKAGGEAGSVTDNWLATFNDPQLDALVAEALLNNPDLRISATRVEQAAQYVELAKSALRPAVNLFGTGGYKAAGGDALQALSLGASWEPDLWGRMRYSRNAYAATYASAQADFEFARQSLAAAVAKSWFTASETWLQLQIAEDMVNSAMVLVTMAEKRWQVGPGNEQDVVLARANRSSYQDAAKQVRLAHTQALRGLELLLGRYPAAELEARHDLPILPGAIPAGLPLEMLERRPDMVAAERRIAAAFNRVGEAKAARLPKIVLNANIAAFSSEVLQLKADYENPTGGAGARLVAPLYAGGALETQVVIRTIQQKEAVALYARQALLALGDVENSLAAASTLAERNELLQHAVADNERARSLVQTSYRVGKVDFRAVQQQLLSLYAARLALLRVQSEQLSQRANLHLVLGGSFTAPVAGPAVAANP